MHNWKLAVKNNQFLKKIFLSLLLLITILYFFAWFLSYIESRKGHVFYDPILHFFRPYDVSDLIFYITYGASLIGIIYSLADPYRTLHICQMYSLLTVFRIITLFLLPLDPPNSLIPLKDSILESTFYNGANYVKDLFFSGHTATLFLFFFFVWNKFLKWIFFISGLIVAIAVVVQHVHYSYDVIVAPLFAFVSYKIVVKHSRFYFHHKNSLITTDFSK